MERKIGEIFECGSEWYQCINATCACSGCHFFTPDGLCSQSCDDCILGHCEHIHRADNKDVIFKKLEKVGEPYKNYYAAVTSKTFQKYKLPFRYPKFLGKTNTIIEQDNNDTIDIEIKQNKEDMEEKKLNLKPFDIQKAREGKPVCTRDGRKVRIICFDSNGGRPIVALVTECDDEEEIPYKYHCDGFYNCQSIPSDNDLMMLPEKKEGWVIVSKNATIYNNLDDAKKIF